MFDLVLYPTSDDTRYTLRSGNKDAGFLLEQEDAPDRPIGFCLLYVNGCPHICIMQAHFLPEPVEITCL